MNASDSLKLPGGTVTLIGRLEQSSDRTRKRVFIVAAVVQIPATVFILSLLWPDRSHYLHVLLVPVFAILSIAALAAVWTLSRFLIHLAARTVDDTDVAAWMRRFFWATLGGFGGALLFFFSLVGTGDWDITLLPFLPFLLLAGLAGAREQRRRLDGVDRTEDFIAIPDREKTARAVRMIVLVLCAAYPYCVVVAGIYLLSPRTGGGFMDFPGMFYVLTAPASGIVVGMICHNVVLRVRGMAAMQDIGGSRSTFVAGCFLVCVYGALISLPGSTMADAVGESAATFAQPFLIVGSVIGSIIGWNRFVARRAKDDPPAAKDD